MCESKQDDKLLRGPSVKMRLPMALSIEDQILELKVCGLEIKDEDAAVETLRNVSYRRLTGYLPGLNGEDGCLRPDATFEMLKELYDFDSDLRRLVFRATEKIEMIFKARLTNFFSLEYGPYGYLDSGNLGMSPGGRTGKGEGPEETGLFSEGRRRRDHAVITVDEMRKCVKENAQLLFFYDGGEKDFNMLPTFCEAVEFMSFGLVTKFYKNMKTEDRMEFRDEYYAGVKCSRLDSWLGAVGYAGNMCAHHNKLYNVRLMVKPVISCVEIHGRRETIGNDRIFGLLLCMKRLLNDDDAKEFLGSLKELLGRYPKVNIKTMGFPQDWEELLRDGVVY